MVKVGYKHSAEHNAKIAASVRKFWDDPTRPKTRRGWQCPPGFEQFYKDLSVKLGAPDARELIEQEAARKRARDETHRPKTTLAQARGQS